MNLELDHFFILTEPGARSGDLVTDLGVVESFSRHHEGQGTSNRRFPVSNSMLELLWVRDDQEARNGPAKRMLFPDRATNKEASPFGFIFTRTVDFDESFPFSGWQYQPDYFEPPMAFHIGENSNEITEPLCIYAPFVRPFKREIKEGLFQSISKVKVTIPSKRLSPTMEIVRNAKGLEIETGNQHLMEITFNIGSAGRTADLRPNLPLIIRW